MTDVHDPTAGATTPVGELQPTSPGPLAKGKNRQRLLRGLQRISSSQSLNGLRRSRSVGSPYKNRGSLSCASLAAVGPPTASGLTRSPLSPPATSSSSAATDLTGEYPFYDNGDTFAVRRIANASAEAVSGVAQVPVDFKFKQDALNRAASNKRRQRPPFQFWARVPHEVQLRILSYLEPKELIRTSRVSKQFYRFCFDGQLWTTFNASEFYQDIPAESVARIIVAAGPFIKELNLRGCVQVEHYKRTEVIVKACKNLLNASLEGCRNIHKNSLHALLRNNERLMDLNLTGLAAVSNHSCRIIAESCPQLERLDVSWCEKVEARGLKAVLEGCPRLKDLRAREIQGFDNISAATAIFETNNLERLVLSGCTELTDEALSVMMHGVDPEIDILTDVPVVPARKLRHLDLTRCQRLSDDGVRSLGHLTPDLEGLQLSGCKSLTDAALEPVLASTPRLTHLELEDLEDITNALLSEHLAKAPCATTLEHLSLSYCENIGDTGMLPVMQKCTALRSVDIDNTRISDLVLAEAAYMVVKRSTRSLKAGLRPKVTLQMAVYDCQNVTWTGIREILFRNTEIKPAPGHSGHVTYPTEVVGLKCFYGFQMTVNEHQKRVLRGDLLAASKLERKWAEYMQATEEAGVGGVGYRRRRRRARAAAEALNLNDDEAALSSRRRARTMGSCAVM